MYERKKASENSAQRIVNDSRVWNQTGREESFCFCKCIYIVCIGMVLPTRFVKTKKLVYKCVK